MSKLSRFETFNGKHSREKVVVVSLLYELGLNGINGISQQEICCRTGINPDTLNSAICKWRRWGLIKRSGHCVKDNKLVFLYTIGKEGEEWIQDVAIKRPDVIKDCQDRINSQRHYIDEDIEVLSVKEAFAN